MAIGIQDFIYRALAWLSERPTGTRKIGTMENICIQCHSTDVPMALIENKTVHCCYHCGTVYVQDNQFILTIDTLVQSPLYSVARAASEIYRLYGSMDNVPMNEA